MGPTMREDFRETQRDRWVQSCGRISGTHRETDGSNHAGGFQGHIERQMGPTMREDFRDT